MKRARIIPTTVTYERRGGDVALIHLTGFNSATTDNLHAAIDKARAELASDVETRLREVYEGYRQVSQRKTTVGGSPAVEYRYRGKADEHDWSGTLVVIARGNNIFTALGMTYADSDLIQIQENVIAKAISSLDFTAR